MHEAVVLGFLEYGHSLVISNVVAAAGLAQVVGHIAHSDAPVAVVVGAALVQLLAAVAAGADAHSKMPLVALEPVGDVLDVDGLVLHRDGLLDGNHVHTDAGAAHRHHRSNLLKGQEGHTLEEHSELGMPVHKLHVHIGIFGASGHEHRHPVLPVFTVVGSAGHGTVLGVFVAVIVFHHSEIAEFVQQGVEFGVGGGVMLLVVPFHKFGIFVVLAHLKEFFAEHIQQQVQGGFPCYRIHLVLENAGKTPIFGVVGGHLDLSGDAVRHAADKFYQLRIRVFVAFVLRDKFG